MKYKVLAFDIDGTLVNTEKKLLPETKEAIQKAAKAGCTIVIASGRPRPGVVDYARALELDKFGGYILDYNGGQVENFATGELVVNETLPKEYNAEIVDTAREYGVHILSYDGDTVISETPEDKYIDIEIRINKLGSRKVDDIRSYLTYEVPKYIMVGEGDYLAEIEPKVAAKLSDRMDVTRSEPFFLEIMPKDVNKAKSLEKLLTHLGYTRENLMTFGDGFNDISMIEYAGLGVAMCNGNEKCKAAADYVTTKSNDENGIVEALEKFVLV